MRDCRAEGNYAQRARGEEPPSKTAETEGRVEVRDTEEIKETGGDETGPEGQQQHQLNHLLMSTMIQYIIYKGVITM